LGIVLSSRSWPSVVWSAGTDTLVMPESRRQ
jgi:hypothetical protein